MKEILYLSDFLSSEISGGAEINDEEFLSRLKAHYKDGINLTICKCIDVKYDLIKSSDLIILSNFISLSPFLLDYISEYKKYILYEHDHKYLKTRQPNLYKDFTAPVDHVINQKVYKNALEVFVQSSFHEKILKNNLEIDNVYNISGNFWSEEILKYMRALSKNPKEFEGFSIMDSNISHKNTLGCIKVCEKLERNFRLIKGDYKVFLRNMSKTTSFLFIPLTTETLSRIVVEAKLMGCRVMTSSMVGATHESWFKLPAVDLLEYIENRMNEVILHTADLINENCD